jgi:outer membrane protein assembly factor BamB
MWRRDVGDGYGSMAIVEGRLFTMERHGDSEGVHVYDATTGQDLWRDRFDTDFKHILGNDGSQTTPTLNSGRVYTLGVTGEFRCLDAATGRLLWRHDIVLENGGTLPEWGLATSPLVVDDKVIVLPGGPAGHSVVAYDKVSDGVRQILSVSAARVAGLRIEDGALLWQHPWRTSELGLNIAQPVVVNGTAIVLSAGYGHGAAMLDVRRTNGNFRARQLWATRELESKFSGPVLFGRHVYGFDEQDLVCLDLDTGKATWRQKGTFGFGQLVLAGTSLIVVSEWGDLALVAATSARFRQLASFQPLTERTYNVPALADATLFVRSRRELKAFDLRRHPDRGGRQ